MTTEETATIIKDADGNFRLQDRDLNIYEDRYSSEAAAIEAIEKNIENRAELNFYFELDGDDETEPTFTSYIDTAGNFVKVAPHGITFE